MRTAAAVPDSAPTLAQLLTPTPVEVALARVDVMLAAATSQEHVRHAMSVGSGLVGGLHIAGAIDADTSVTLQARIADRANARLAQLRCGVAA